MKNILIVGANSFIAKNTVERLFTEGYNCFLTFRTTGNKNQQLDIEDESSIVSFCNIHKNVLFDGLLFFQGVNPSKNTKDMTSEHFFKMLSVNLVGPALLLKHFYNNLSKDAMVLFISSVAANKGSYDPSYAAAKSALSGFVQSLSNEFSDFRFNTISLGLVENSPVFNNMTPDFRKKHSDRMNNRFIQVNDVSSAICELIRNESINKVTLNIDGGFKN